MRVCTCSRLAVQIAVDISGNDGESKIKCKMECQGEMEIMSLFAWENIGKIKCVCVDTMEKQMMEITDVSILDEIFKC